MFKERGIIDRGRLKAMGLNGYYSFGDHDVPLTFQTELNIGQHQETYDELMYFLTYILKGDYLLTKGLNATLHYNLFIDDLFRAVHPIEEHRIGIGGEWTIVYGFRLTSEYRITFTSRGDINNEYRGSPTDEFFVYLYTYF